ncbi:unnamed protein product [Parajaminaea phylloscopi]
MRKTHGELTKHSLTADVPAGLIASILAAWLVRNIAIKDLARGAPTTTDSPTAGRGTARSLRRPQPSYPFGAVWPVRVRVTGEDERCSSVRSTVSICRGPVTVTLGVRQAALGPPALIREGSTSGAQRPPTSGERECGAAPSRQRAEIPFLHSLHILGLVEEDPPTMSSRTSASEVNALLEKMKSQDADFRFMALNDLIADSQKGGLGQLDPDLESRLIHQILELMKDTNGEVKNMAVRSLGVLVGRIRERQMQVIIDQLVRFLSTKDEELRDIASLGLKTVVAEIPVGSTTAKSACDSLAPRLLEQLNEAESSQELLIDSLDILTDLFSRFPRAVLENSSLQKVGLHFLVPMLSHSRMSVRKRTTNALSALAAHSASDIFTQLSTTISVDLSETTDLERSKTVVQLVGALARSCPRRLGRRLPDFMPRILQIVHQDDDELSEISLQTLELILLRCPVEVTPFLNQISELAVRLIKHDPNFAGGHVSDEEMTDDLEDDLEDEDDDLGVEEDYSDDDDISWKVRRAACKVLNAAISTRPELLTTVVTNVAPVLIGRFSEREESVRLEVLQTMLSLIKQVQLAAGLAQATEVRAQSPGALKRKRAPNDAEETSTSPRTKLHSLLPTLADALLRVLASKSSSTRLVAISILRELVAVLNGGLESHIPAIVSQLHKLVHTIDQSNSAGPALKTEVIALLRVVFTTHTPASYEAQLSVVVPILAAAITDKAHKECLEALEAAADLIDSLYSPAAGEPSTTTTSHTDHVNALYDATLTRLKRQDSDQEIKELGIATLGVLMSRAGAALHGSATECLSFLVERLRNEVTRYASVKVAEQIASSKACEGPVFIDFFQQTADQISGFLRQNNRALKLSAFDALAAILQRLGQELQPATAQIIVTEIQVLLSQDVDVGLLPHALKTVGTLVVAQPAVLPAAQEHILPRMLELMKSPLLQGVALDAVVAFIKVMVSVDHSMSADVVSRLHTAFENGAIAATVARCIGAALSADSSAAPRVVDEASNDLQTGKKDEVRSTFNLLVLGELARIEDVDKHPHILQQILAQFASQSEEVRGAAAFALGNMAVGNLPAFMPVIQEHIEVEGKERLLALAALKELITHGSVDQLSQVAEQIWAPLFDICQIKDEATRNIGAECLARLTLTDPRRYLVQLQGRLSDASPSTRAAVIAAVRFTLTEASTSYDELLAPMLFEFLSLLRDEDLDVRRHTMFALNSAAHNKPQLLRDHLNLLLPLVYEETHVRKELMRKVQMGPFTVTQDDGLDLRKNAFETMYTLLDACLSQIGLPEYLSRVIAGLRDDDQIKLLCYLILIRLADLVPVQVAQSLDEISEPIAESLKTKLKDGATKQDVEKSTELTRAAFRALVALQRTAQVPAPRFHQLVREARAGPSAGLYSEVEASAVSQ